MRRVLSKKVIAVIAMATITTTLMTNISPIKVQATSDENITQAQGVENKYRNVLYYEDYSIWKGQEQYYPKYVPAKNITHLIYGGVDIDINGNLIFKDMDAALSHQLGQSISYDSISAGLIQAFKVLKQNNPNLKTGITIGGWRYSKDFSLVCSNEYTRKNLASNIAKLLKYTDMDLVDIDWEYPGLVRQPDFIDPWADEGSDGTPQDKYNYTLLLKDIRAELNKLSTETDKKYELSVKLPATKDLIDMSVDFNGLFNEIDFANIVSYKFREDGASVSGHTSPLYTNPKDPLASQNLSVDGAINTYLKNGAPSKKLVVGTSYNTQGWESVNNTGTDINTPGLFGTCNKVNENYDGSFTTGAIPEVKAMGGTGNVAYNGEWRYGSIIKLRNYYPNLKEYWDDIAKAPYLYDSVKGTFFTYENVNSISAKTDYIIKNNLGGMMGWMASADRQTDVDNRARNELILATAKGLGQLEPANVEQKYYKKNITIEKSVSKPAWDTGSLITIKLTNNEKLVETNGTLKKLEERGKTFTNYSLYVKLANGKVVEANVGNKLVNENGYAKVSSMLSPNLTPSSGVYIDLRTDNVITENDILEVYLTEKVYSDSPEYNKTISIDALTLSKTANIYNSQIGDSNYNGLYDLNSDGIVDLYDLSIIAKRL